MKAYRCDVCGSRDYFIDQLRSIYRVVDTEFICENCAEKVNKFVNYYGPKKDKDRQAVKRFLNSGINATRAYESMMNAGYYLL